MKLAVSDSRKRENQQSFVELPANRAWACSAIKQRKTTRECSLASTCNILNRKSEQWSDPTLLPNESMAHLLVSKSPTIMMRSNKQRPSRLCPGKSKAAAYPLPTNLRSRVFLQPACWDRRRPRLLLVQKPMSDSRSGMHSRLLLLQPFFLHSGGVRCL